MLAENHVMQVVLYKNIVSPYTHGYALAQVCDWDEFSEYLLENRVLSLVDFNMYPIRILRFLLAPLSPIILKWLME